MKKIALMFDAQAIFHPKPFDNIGGSGMHYNITLHNGEFNIFSSDNIHYNVYLKKIITSILDLLRCSMYFVLAHEENEYIRISHHNIYSISTASWGINNRTTAIRVPCSLATNRRIEFRMPSAIKDPLNVIIFILFAIIRSYNLQNEKEFYPIYGNAKKKIALQQVNLGS